MIKKYKANTQEEALKMASDELGQDAIVLSIKKVSPRGFLSNFKKPYVEISATNYYEKNTNNNESNEENNEENNEEVLFQNDKLNIKVSDFNSDFSLQTQLDKSGQLKNKLDEKDEQIRMLENQLKQMNETFKQAISSLNNSNKYKNSFINFIYDLLRSQQVSDNLCREILSEFEDNFTNEQNNIDFIIKSVYNKILIILENAKTPTISQNSSPKTQKIVFFGNTGVGKTTTIAKISSNIIMQKGCNVSFVTLDTYRIAAAEQLKIYADILDCDVKVIYDLNEVNETVQSLSVMNDFIFFDTAGRSHNNTENMNEIKKFVELVPDSENYLILSSGTKFEDMVNIIDSYSKFTDFKIIFTKLDETNSLGNILNIAKYTDKKIAYLTNGQNVPIDIEEFSPTKIAKTLLESIYK